MPRLILALALFCVAGHTMPSYDDVLIVVKQGDAEPAAAAQYFKEQRQIPDENLVTCL